MRLKIDYEASVTGYITRLRPVPAIQSDYYACGANIDSKATRSPNNRRYKLNADVDWLRTFLKRFAEESIHASTQAKLLRAVLTIGAEGNNYVAC